MANEPLALAIGRRRRPFWPNTRRRSRAILRCLPSWASPFTNSVVVKKPADIWNMLRQKPRTVKIRNVSITSPVRAMPWENGKRPSLHTNPFWKSVANATPCAQMPLTTYADAWPGCKPFKMNRLHSWKIWETGSIQQAMSLRPCPL